MYVCENRSITILQFTERNYLLTNRSFRVAHSKSRSIQRRALTGESIFAHLSVTMMRTDRQALSTAAAVIVVSPGRPRHRRQETAMIFIGPNEKLLLSYYARVCIRASKHARAYSANCTRGYQLSSIACAVDPGCQAAQNGYYGLNHLINFLLGCLLHFLTSCKSRQSMLHVYAVYGRMVGNRSLRRSIRNSIPT